MKIYILETENTKNHTYSIMLSFFENKLMKIAMEEFESEKQYLNSKALLKNSNNQLNSKEKIITIMQKDENIIVWKITSKEIGSKPIDTNIFLQELMEQKAKEKFGKELKCCRTSYGDDRFSAILYL